MNKSIIPQNNRRCRTISQIDSLEKKMQFVIQQQRKLFLDLIKIGFTFFWFKNLKLKTDCH